MFTKMVYMRKYLEKGQESYVLIQDRVIKELLNINFKGYNSDELVKFIYSLPYTSKALLPLLSYFI